jgi:hypothetical protein
MGTSTGGSTASSINTAGAIGQGAGAVAQAYASYAGASAAKSNLEFKSRLDKIAAAREEYRAVQASSRGSDRLFKLRTQQGQMEGEQRALLAAQGVDLTEGSGARILADTKYISDLDAAALEDNTAQEIMSIREAARARTFDSYVHQGAADQISPLAAAATSALGSAGSIAARWYNYSGNAGGGAAASSGYTPTSQNRQRGSFGH